MIKYAKQSIPPGLNPENVVTTAIDLWKEARELYILLDELVHFCNEYQHTSSVKQEYTFEKAEEILTKE